VETGRDTADRSDTRESVAASRPGPTVAPPRRRHPVRMRHLATGLLALMAVVFLAARYFEPVHPALGWVRAFAEAAMVGALADWFAVTALFRHPMGVPIPHTAIVPRNKDRIGRNLADFVATNFLASSAVREQIAGVDFVASFAEWLLEPDRPRKLAERIADRIPALLRELDALQLREFLRDSVDRRLREIELAPIVGEVLIVLTAAGRHHRLVDQLIDEFARLLAEYEPAIRGRVREKTAWLWRSVGIDVAVSDKIIRAAEEVLAELGHDPQHPWRRKLDEVLTALGEDLKTSPDYGRKLTALKGELLDHPVLQQYVAGVWDDVQKAIAADVGREGSVIAQAVEQGIKAFAAALVADETARERLNRWLRGAIVRVTEAQRDQIGQLIADTIRRWDPVTFTERIESYVGDDLQYIRINGTLIGGLVGLAIHAVSLAMR
jgi:uncharacterized membrane-anchored protein YjiN (DUF445 family)